MPNVPNVPGVPKLSSFSPNTFVLLAADVVSVIALLTGASKWGVFLDGLPMIFADSFVSFGFRQDFPISDYQVEQGQFQTYDKVQLPAEIRVRYSAGRSDANRQAFLASVDAVMTTTDIYDVVTPERAFLGYNFTHRDLERTSKNGVGLLVVDLWLTEVREGAAASFQNTQQPAQAGAQGLGSVQPQSVPAPTQNQVKNTISTLNIGAPSGGTAW